MGYNRVMRSIWRHVPEAGILGGASYLYYLGGISVIVLVFSLLISGGSLWGKWKRRGKWGY